jgi:hypothetical protein
MGCCSFGSYICFIGRIGFHDMFYNTSFPDDSFMTYVERCRMLDSINTQHRLFSQTWFSWAADRSHTPNEYIIVHHTKTFQLPYKVQTSFYNIFVIYRLIPTNKKTQANWGGCGREVHWLRRPVMGCRL